MVVNMAFASECGWWRRMWLVVVSVAVSVAGGGERG